MKRGPTDRRALLKASLAVPLMMQPTAPVSAAISKDELTFDSEHLLADVRTYSDAGNKRSGGSGDQWTADWMATRLDHAGFSVERQRFETPWFDSSVCQLEIGDLRVELVAQPHIVTTTEKGLIAPLCLAEFPGRLDGTIAVVRLPHRRWSSLLDPVALTAIKDVSERGAAAVILVTTGPSGEALLLNVPANRPAPTGPLAILAPRLAAPVIEAARHRREARLLLRGEGGVRPAENVIGRIVRRGQPWLVVSTPRSGWTVCAGERGPGVAIWLALADWMPLVFQRHNLLFVSNSGHEYENLGASHLVETFGPPPAETDFWLHLGANAATRDWQEIPGRLLPLPSPDPNRFLMLSSDLVERAREIFKGQLGIEMAYSSAEGTAGELSEIIKAGYSRHAGIFGAHRHHHAATDDFSTVAAEPLAATARGFRNLLLRAVSVNR